MVDARIDVDLDCVTAGERRLHLFHRRHRHVLVLAGEVQRHRAGDLVRLVQRLLDADAVIADGAVDICAGRRQIGKLAAQAEAERADLAGLLRQRPKRDSFLYKNIKTLSELYKSFLEEELKYMGPSLNSLSLFSENLRKSSYKNENSSNL